MDDGSKYGHSRTILHMDMDCFYAQVETLHNPELVGLPLGIQQKTILATVNYIARARGVPKMCKITEAKKICPDIVIVNGEILTKYRKASEDIFQLVCKSLPQCPAQRLGLDEIFVDISTLVTACLDKEKMVLENSKALEEQTPLASLEFRLPSQLSSWKGHIERSFSQDDFVNDRNEETKECGCGCLDRLRIGTNIGAELKRVIKSVLGFTSCIGIAHNKLLAKVGGSLHKPDQQTCVLPGAAMRILNPSSVRKIPNIGRSASKRLAALDVYSGSDVREKDLSFLVENLGEKTGLLIYELVRGIDDSDVKMSGPQKTLSNEDNLGRCTDLATLASRLEPLISRLLERMDDEYILHDRLPRTIRMTLRTKSYHDRISKQTAIPANILLKQDRGDRVTEIMDLCMLLVTELIKHPFIISVVNVAFTNFNDRPNDAPSLKKFLINSTELEPKGKRSYHEHDFFTTDAEIKYQDVNVSDDTLRFLPQEIDSESSEDEISLGSHDAMNIHCTICDINIPMFCWEAHERFHKETGILN